MRVQINFSSPTNFVLTVNLDCLENVCLVVPFPHSSTGTAVAAMDAHAPIFSHLCRRLFYY